MKGTGNCHHIPSSYSASIECRAEALINPYVCFERVLGNEGPDFACESNGDFDRVAGASLKQQKKNLKGDKFVCYCLIDQVESISVTQIEKETISDTCPVSPFIRPSELTY
jgi:hypothetical protein